jgi:predicted protein tyrosine phosphatase
MKEVHPGLWVGSQADYEEIFDHHKDAEWAIVHACKEPHHREALGYAGRAAPKDHPDYLFVSKPGKLILNLIDAADPKYVPREIIRRAIDFIDENLAKGQKVLVHCNQGGSRAPTIAMLWMVFDRRLPVEFEEAEKKFLELYPGYEPAAGMRGFARENWDHYRTLGG